MRCVSADSAGVGGRADGSRLNIESLRGERRRCARSTPVATIAAAA